MKEKNISLITVFFFCLLFCNQRLEAKRVRLAEEKQ